MAQPQNTSYSNNMFDELKQEDRQY